VRRHWRLHPCSTKPFPEASKGDPPLAKVEPISDVGTKSMIMCLRKGTQYWERGLRKYETKNSAETKVSEEGGGRGAPGAGAEIFLQPVVKTMVKQVVLLKPIERTTLEQISTLQPVLNPTPEQADVPLCKLQPLESLHWNRFLAGPVTPWGSILEHSIPEGLHPVERIHAGAVHEELQPMGSTLIGAVHEGLSAVAGIPMLEHEEYEEEGAAETKYYEQTTIPILHINALLMGRK